MIYHIDHHTGTVSCPCKLDSGLSIYHYWRSYLITYVTWVWCLFNVSSTACNQINTLKKLFFTYVAPVLYLMFGLLTVKYEIIHFSVVNSATYIVAVRYMYIFSDTAEKKFK